MKATTIIKNISAFFRNLFHPENKKQKDNRNSFKKAGYALFI